ncbi:MAG: V-type ATP synthase subunit F [Clostridia bacterium]|nr:V-type ATP synthase subunit F [Clostridia bacterium]
MILRVITDNASAAQGFRLGGMECTVAALPAELESALKTALADENTAAVFITRKLYDANAALIREAEAGVLLPVVVRIDDN